MDIDSLIRRHGSISAKHYAMYVCILKEHGMHNKLAILRNVGYALYQFTRRLCTCFSVIVSALPRAVDCYGLGC